MNDRIEELRGVLREDPSSRQFYQLGELLRKEGRLQEAEDVLRRGLEHHPRYVAAWVSLARTLAAAGDDEGAEWAAARALETDPQNAVAARLIAESAERRGDHRRAASAWRLAAALAPGEGELEARARAAEERLRAAEGGGPEVQERETPGEVSPEEEVAPAEAEAAESEAGAGLPGVVVAAAEEDPFAVQPTGDTDVFFLGDDVFGEAPPPEEGAPFAPGPEPAPAGEPPEAPRPGEPAPLPEAEPAPAPEEGAGGEAVPHAPPADLEVPVSEPTRPIPEAELPLPTVTLARLALEQGDLELAQRTLERVRQLRGDDPEVTALAREIAVRRARSVPLAARKAERLKGWLEHIRLAAERSGGGLR